jgi:hypothetical protein
VTAARDRALSDTAALRSARVEVQLHDGRTVTRFTRHGTGTKDFGDFARTKTPCMRISMPGNEHFSVEVPSRKGVVLHHLYVPVGEERADDVGMRLQQFHHIRIGRGFDGADALGGPLTVAAILSG